MEVEILSEEEYHLIEEALSQVEGSHTFTSPQITSNPPSRITNSADSSAKMTSKSISNQINTSPKNTTNNYNYNTNYNKHNNNQITTTHSNQARPLKGLEDILDNSLRLIIVGDNPGILSSQEGHHYSHPTNQFWKLLYESGTLLVVLLLSS